MRFRGCPRQKAHREGVRGVGGARVDSDAPRAVRQEDARRPAGAGFPVGMVRARRGGEGVSNGADQSPPVGGVLLAGRPPFRRLARPRALPSRNPRDGAAQVRRESVRVAASRVPASLDRRNRRGVARATSRESREQGDSVASEDGAQGLARDETRRDVQAGRRARRGKTRDARARANSRAAVVAAVARRREGQGSGTRRGREGVAVRLSTPRAVGREMLRRVVPGHGGGQPQGRKLPREGPEPQGARRASSLATGHPPR